MAAQHIPGTERIADAGPEAPWIVMVHGVSQDHRVFSAQVRDFRKTHRLLLIDLPGHGLSAAVPGPFGLNEFAASVHAAVVGAGSDRFHFWGTHIGASAGLLLATSHPELFASLVLEAPVFPGRTLPAVSETVGRVAIERNRRGKTVMVGGLRMVRRHAGASSGLPR